MAVDGINFNVDAASLKDRFILKDSLGSKIISSIIEIVIATFWCSGVNVRGGLVFTE